MGQGFYIDMMNRALMLVLISSLPPILVATAVGLLVAFFQALTQVQDQTLPFAIKLIATVLVIIYAANWVFADLLKFAMSAMRDFPVLAQ
jgi:type III secretion HrpO family protein